MSHTIDLNADLGEGYGAYTYGADQQLLSLVTSANIACGWHGGDPGIMRRAAALACENNVTVGAHPGYPDRMGFGRRFLDMTPREVTDALLYQIGALEGVCRSVGTAVAYVKPHGALYNAAARDAALAEAVAEAVRSFSAGLFLLCPAGSEMERAALAVGISVAREFFADRAYRRDGSLVPRGEPGAVISEPELICRRVLRAVQEGMVEAVTGEPVAVKLDSICLHGDNPAAAALACRIREVLVENGVALKPFAGGYHGR